MMSSDSQRTRGLSICVAHRDYYCAINARLAGACVHISSVIRLNIAARDRFIPLECEAGHTLPDWHKSNYLGHLRWKSHLGFEDQHTVFEQVY